MRLFISQSAAASSSRQITKTRTRRGSAALLAATAMLFAGANAPTASAAATLFLNFNGTGTWEDGANWSAGVLPTTGDNAFIESGFSVTTSTANNVAFELQVGVGTNAYNAVGNPGGTGQLTLLSGGVITTDGNLVVGQAQTSSDSSGTINIEAGSTLNIKGGNSFLGFFGESIDHPTVGTINVNGGDFHYNAGNNNATLWIGGDSITNRRGRGVLNLNSGNVTGAAIRVGDFGTGVFNMAGGTFTSNFYMAIGLGNNPNEGSGAVNLSGGTMNLAQMTLNENKAADCVFTQTGGTLNVGGNGQIDGYNFRVGLSNSGKGIYNMSGGALNVAGNDLWVGAGKEGVLNISGNSAVTVNYIPVPDRSSDYGLALGGAENGTATVNQTGGTVEILNTSLLGLFYKGGNGGTSTYNLAGGTFKTGGISSDDGTTAKTFNFNGGTLIAGQSMVVPNPNRVAEPTNFFTTISAGGATINTNAFDVEWKTALSGPGAMNKTGAGSLTLSNNNIYAGGTTVTAGTLLVTNLSGSGTGTGAVNVQAGATLGGTGAVGGNTSIAGRLAPGAIDATGSITFGGTLTTQTGSTTAIQLASSSSVDHVSVIGAATLGGAIELAALNGYEPAYGVTHRVLDAGSVVGHFATVSGHQLAPTRWLAVTYDATGVNVTAALPGDTNLTNTVNFTDLLVLAQNYGQSNRVWAQGDFSGNGIVDFADLLSLAQNYGQTASLTDAIPSNIAADWALALSMTVPEPTSLSLLSLTLAAGARRRRTVVR